MADKTNVEVTINGKILVLSGYEKEEYYNRQAAYLNDKYSECKAKYDFSHMSIEAQHMLIELAVTDDLFMAREKIKELEEALSEKKNALYEIKHELVTTRMKYENMQKKSNNESN